MKVKFAAAVVFLITLTTLLIVFCATPQDPRTNSANAKFDKEHSLKSFPTTLEAFHTYSCTLNVILPELVDSINILLKTGNGDSTIWVLKSPPAGDTVVPFPFTAGGTSPESFTVYLHKSGASVIDSLPVTVTVTTPKIGLLNIPDQCNAFENYSCAVQATLPDRADSIVVQLKQGAAYGTIKRFSSLTASDTLLDFSLTVTAKNQGSLQAFYYRDGSVISSAAKSFAIEFPPTVVPDSLQYHTYTKSSVAIKFHITDPDSNIRQCQIWADSMTSAIIAPLSGTDSSNTTASQTINVTGFDTIVVHAQALDRMGNFSNVAQCTVFVLDTVKPTIPWIHISSSIGDTSVNALPCTLSVKVLDDSHIDSVKFQNQLMNMHGDTASVAIVALDSGKVKYPIVAWDHAKNRDSITIPINYTGTIKYKLTLRTGLGETVAEDKPIKVLLLDSCIASITPDPKDVGIPNWRDSLVWTITPGDTSSRSIQPTLYPILKRVGFAVGDSEWNGTETFTLLANWPGTVMAAGSATYTVTPINDPPRLTWKTSCMKTPFDSLLVDAYKSATDPDNAVTSLTWTDTAQGTFFMLERQYGLLRTGKEESIPVTIIPRFWNGTWKIVPKPGVKFFTILGKSWTGTDTLRVAVSDGQYTDSGKVIISIPCPLLLP